MKTILIKSILLGTALGTTIWLNAGDDKRSEKMEAKVVDSGSFGIYVNGKRIGTETFKIEQRPDFSVATAEVKVDDGTVKSVQTAEMQVSPTGDLHSYVWRASVPAKEEDTVEPNDPLLTEHLIPADSKKVDVPHILPLSTPILDDNFFSHREVLLWRYLATGCVQKPEGRVCGTSNFNVLIPRQHTVMKAAMAVIGPEKLSVKGSVKELSKVVLQVGDPTHVIIMNSDKNPEPGQWFLWVDDQLKVIKMTIPNANVEVIRD